MEPAHAIEGGKAPVTPALAEDPEPRWPAIVSLLCIGVLNYALPPALSVGPRWLLFTIVGVLMIPTVLLHQAGHHRLNAMLGHAVAGIITTFMIFSIYLLVHALLFKHALHKTAEFDLTGIQLLHSAAFLWLTNVIVFGQWYWRLDAGGPNMRDMRPGHACGSFLFPQMTLDEDLEFAMTGKPWSPQFVDYLFLAFNTSTALSPADTAVLSRWAKMLMMLQATISLTIIVLLAARAVNIIS